MKFLGCSLDDEKLNNLNPAQMLWYGFMFNKEKEEEFDEKLNLTEYLASFINYEAVRQTKEARESKKTVSDESFDNLLRKEFGRDLNEESIKTALRADVLEERPIKQEQKKKGNISIEDIKKYTGLELDDIRYIPKK